MIVAGLGCRRGCPAADLVAAVRQAASSAGLTVGALAAPAFKAHEAGLQEATALLGLPMLLVDDAAMRAAQPRCVTRSAAARAATGLASVAEAAALAASGSALLLPRVAVGGATCALAGPLSSSPPGLGEGVLSAEWGTAGVGRLRSQAASRYACPFPFSGPLPGEEG